MRSHAESSTADEANSSRPNREGQEDQLGALGLVMNAVVLWNTRYLDHTITNMTDAGIDNDDVMRLSPLGSDHINMVGRYHFETRTVSRPHPLAINP